MTKSSPPEIVTVAGGDERPPAELIDLLEERGSSRLLRNTLLAIVAVVLGLLLWAGFTSIDELARARGEMKPAGDVQSLQSEEGGRIVRLLVAEGDVVQLGQPIAEFAATQLNKDLAQVEIRINGLAIDRERMLAVLERRQPDFKPFAEKYPLLVQQARATYNAQITSRDALASAKRGESGQQESMLSGLQQEQELVTRQLNEARERLQRMEDGARKGVVTKNAVSEARQQFSSLQERQADISARIASTRKSIGTVGAESSRIQADFAQQLSSELSKATEQYRELLAERDALQNRQGRRTLVAPVAGVVMNLPHTTEGAVVAAGGLVAEIVPQGQELVMETMVSPRDIGFVKVGQKAYVKIDSYDPARFGAVQGTVRKVAPTSTKARENTPPFYRVEIVLAQAFVGAPEHRLLPGMTGEADIATGSKSVLQYLLKPIFLTADTAFHER